MLRLTQNGEPFYMVGMHFHWRENVYHLSMLNYVGLTHKFIQGLSYTSHEDWVSLARDTDPIIRRLVVENMQALDILSVDPDPTIAQKAAYYFNLAIPA